MKEEDGGGDPRKGHNLNVAVKGAVRASLREGRRGCCSPGRGVVLGSQPWRRPWRVGLSLCLALLFLSLQAVNALQARSNK